jgi:hypothetical protein
MRCIPFVKIRVIRGNKKIRRRRIVRRAICREGAKTSYLLPGNSFCNQIPDNRLKKPLSRIASTYNPVDNSFAVQTNYTINKPPIMIRVFFSALLFLCIALPGTAQQLTPFTVTLQAKEAVNSYLSVSQQKVYTPAEAKSNKAAVDIALVITESGNHQVVEWYNMTGKDDKIPVELRGTATGIAGLSWDKELFDKCNTSQDLKRMTGSITNNSFSHFGSITDDLEKGGVKYHLFLLQLENGKRALLWLEGVDATHFKAMVKAE